MTTATNNRTQTNIKLFVAFLVVVLSSTGAFAQANANNAAPTASTEVVASKDATIVIAEQNNVAAAMDFAVWFTGSKKSSENTVEGFTFSKKNLINSGIKTNSVLIRSILKKISTQENGVA